MLWYEEWIQYTQSFKLHFFFFKYNKQLYIWNIICNRILFTGPYCDPRVLSPASHSHSRLANTYVPLVFILVILHCFSSSHLSFRPSSCPLFRPPHETFAPLIFLLLFFYIVPHSSPSFSLNISNISSGDWWMPVHPCCTKKQTPLKCNFYHITQFGRACNMQYPKEL